MLPKGIEMQKKNTNNVIIKKRRVSEKSTKKHKSSKDLHQKKFTANI